MRILSQCNVISITQLITVKVHVLRSETHAFLRIDNLVVVVVVVAFFLACEDFGRMSDNSFPACAFFFLSLFF